MSTHTDTPRPILINQPSLCIMLGLSRSGLTKLRNRDTSFPKPIKHSTTRQAAAYFILQEIEDWLSKRIELRNGKGA